jgi:AraC-like DNA-binding protein
MLVEALRSVPADLTATGLLAGLRDPQLVAALRAIHTKTAHPWTLTTLARDAAMSRSSFAERFARVVGKTPLNYLLEWRLAVARHRLAREQKSVAETALAVGYESASGFSTAFSREMGMSPKEFIGAHRSSNT